MVAESNELSVVSCQLSVEEGGHSCLPSSPIDPERELIGLIADLASTLRNIQRHQSLLERTLALHIADAGMHQGKAVRS